MHLRKEMLVVWEDPNKLQFNLLFFFSFKTDNLNIYSLLKWGDKKEEKGFSTKFIITRRGKII